MGRGRHTVLSPLCNRQEAFCLPPHIFAFTSTGIRVEAVSSCQQRLSIFPPLTREATIGAIVLISVLFWIGTLIVVPMLVVCLPGNYLTSEIGFGISLRLRPVLRYPYWILKNLFGIIFIVAGIAMLFLPGQGILTIILGLALINFPGKRKVIQRTLGHPRILSTINRLRARAHKAPLQPPHP